MLRIFVLAIALMLVPSLVFAHSDPATHADHIRLLTEIVPVLQATFIAKLSGNWNAPSTWGGAVPVSGARVHIPAGITVNYDAHSAAPLHWVRTDGVLSFSRLNNTKMVVQTLVVGETGRLEIGTKLQPMTLYAAIEFRRITDIMHWTELDLGLIALGDVVIWGQPTTSWVKLAKNPRAGESTLTLATVPSNWQPGGTVVIPGVLPHVRVLYAKQLKLAEIDPQFRTQHEVINIKSISGNVVTLMAPLAQDTHFQTVEKIAVGYLTRNISIYSADPLTNRRGHVMLMPMGHNKRYDLGYFSLNNMGRTHTELHVTDPQLDANGVLIPGTYANVRGRYSLHLHKMGPDNYAQIKGVAVTGALKWGIVNHGSVADIEDCISFNCDGAHYATESGQERGTFVRNMGVRARGFGKANNRYTSPRFLGGGGQDKNYNDTQAQRNERMRIAPVGMDFGFAGYGIWLQGPLVKVDGNELYGCFQSGVTIKTVPVGTDHNGNLIVIDRATLPADLNAALPSDFQNKAPDGYAPLEVIPYVLDANNSYGSMEALVGMDNNPPSSHKSKFLKGGNYNCHVGARNWESAGQRIEDVKFLNDPSSPGVTVFSFYDGTSNVEFINIQAENFTLGIDVPQAGTNIVEGPNTMLRCRKNINFQAETNASNRTFIRLDESNFGLPSVAGWAVDQWNIFMQVHSITSTLPQRNVEWHQSNKPAVRLWSNPALAPAGHFTIPKFNGVATNL